MRLGGRPLQPIALLLDGPLLLGKGPNVSAVKEGLQRSLLVLLPLCVSSSSIGVDVVGSVDLGLELEQGRRILHMAG